jgi:hypothetical protein
LSTYVRLVVVGSKNKYLNTGESRCGLNTHHSSDRSCDKTRGGSDSLGIYCKVFFNMHEEYGLAMKRNMVAMIF